MLKKLLKYEFKAVSKSLVPMLLAIFGLSVLSSFIIVLNNAISRSSAASSVFATIFQIIASIILVFSVIALFASILIVIFLLLQRYYKNFFTDEGYLTFTLPVEVKQLLATKLISGFVWTIVGTIVIFVSIMFFLLFATAEDGHLISFDVLTSFIDGISSFYRYVGTLNSVLFTVEFILLGVIGVISQLLLYYLAITIGSIIAKKHKILASIGMYFAINSVTGIVAGIIMFLIMLISPQTAQNLDSLYGVSHTFLIMYILIYALMGTVSYLICKSMLKNKLNLE